ncbi:MAG: pitrilysin family protein [Acidobacteria bacterium]|nr:pitrilysin family protein [Acidobacteriota bacterium]
MILMMLTGAMALSGAVPSVTAAGVFPYEVKRHTLDNGLKILLIPMPADGLVSYWSVVRTGSRDEVENGVTGFAHFFEHMMFRGSEKYPGPVYDDIVTSMGADANAYTTDDLTAYHLSITREDLPTVIDIESSRFMGLKYSEDEFKTESGAVYGEFRKGRTSPFFTLFEAIQFAAYDVHTYKHTTIGFEDDIKDMPNQYDYSGSFFNRFYRPENVVIMIAGDFDPDATLKLIQEYYGGWKRGYQAPDIPVEPEQTTQRRIDVPFQGQTLPILAVNFKGERLEADNPTMIAGTLIGDLIFGETSPLYRKLVLEEQRVQFLQADFGFNRDPGLWSAFTMVKDPADVAAVEGEIMGAVEALQNKGVSQERLDAVRSNWRYGFLSNLSTPGNVTGAMARLVALTGDVTVVDEMFATATNLTPGDVQAAARNYLTTARSTVAVLHSEGQEIPTPAPAEAPVLLAQKEDPNIAFKLWFKAGSQNDPKGKEGLAAMTADMLGEGGTGKRSYDEILAALYPLAAGYNGAVDKEMTVFSGTAHRDAAGGFYPLFLDAVLNPGFREADFERLRSRAIDALEKQLRYSSDEELGKAALFGTVFAGTPYQHLDMGTVAGLKSITLDDVRKFYATYYTRDNVTVALGGAFDDSMLNRLLADMQRLPEGTPRPVAAPQPSPIKGRKVVLVEKPGESTAISFGYPIDLHRGSRDFYALWLANSWLGEHRNSVSHLYQVIREARGMNYGDYSYIEAFPQGGRRSMPPTGVGRRQQMFEIWIRPVPEPRAVFALRAAVRALDKLIANGLTQEEFEMQQKFLSKYVAQFATSTSQRLGYAVDDRFYGIEDGHLKRFRKAMASLTRDEVNAAIRKYLQSENMVIAMVTADAVAMKDTLVSGKKTPLDYGDLTKPAAVMEEDEEIAGYPLNIKASDVKIVPVDEMFAK